PCITDDKLNVRSRANSWKRWQVLVCQLNSVHLERQYPSLIFHRANGVLTQIANDSFDIRCFSKNRTFRDSDFKADIDSPTPAARKISNYVFQDGVNVDRVPTPSLLPAESKDLLNQVSCLLNGLHDVIQPAL